ncbi:MAG TPA: FGGY-family carbohydrate kinase, partial [Candidatus Limnocylindrales bacterium]
APSFTALIDPEDERFLRPGDLPAHVRAFCAETGQPVPEDLGTLFRVMFESLALRYAVLLGELGAAAGVQPEGIHIVGGGSNNGLLNRLAAGAAGLPVRAGPVEATAIGNLLVQLIATGQLGSLAEGRELVARSFPSTTYEPEGDWAEARARFAAITAR